MFDVKLVSDISFNLLLAYCRGFKEGLISFWLVANFLQLSLICSSTAYCNVLLLATLFHSVCVSFWGCLRVLVLEIFGLGDLASFCIGHSRDAVSPIWVCTRSGTLELCRFKLLCWGVRSFAKIVFLVLISYWHLIRSGSSICKVVLLHGDDG